MLISKSAEETEKIGAEFAKTLEPDAFVAMYGYLGAGKTAFVRGMASVLVPNAFVSSPTYTIVNEYHADDGKRFCHFDMYRITDDDDLYSIGFYDYHDCVIAVEWSENIPFALPDEYYKVTITASENNERAIEIEKVKNK